MVEDSSLAAFIAHVKRLKQLPIRLYSMYLQQVLMHENSCSHRVLCDFLAVLHFQLEAD